MDAFSLILSHIPYFIIFAVIFGPLSYVLEILRFKRDIRKYNSENPSQSIPLPSSLIELLLEYRRFCKLRWATDFLTLYYHYYYSPEDDTNE